ncbi:B-cell differentiation antigen CD72 isoform X2 [Hyaena hyaena]|uniref:B-cell differentiation antigen CD72 isoform X2 n=1 Tax=Hyaena hyaena TaxID=95912 RepID=UPI001923B736|nr:B-cell differentiation antigen CD72 isoform X2 [Hyaena hyaena]
MAEAITYADLRFVKAPLKKNISSRLGHDLEADEDEELTYENVQVPSVSGGPLSLASSGGGNKAGLQSEQPTASWSSVASPAAGRILTDLQVSQQLQQMNSVLEATNSSLRQQLYLKITQLGKREEDMQGSRRELALSQEALQEEQRVHQATQEQLQACQSDREKTKEALQSEEEQRRILEQKLSRMQDTMKPLFTCPASDTCCPLGWILSEKSCFYISFTARTWEESQNHCKSLSSDLAMATFSDYYLVNPYSVRKVLTEVSPPGPFWVTYNYAKMQQSDSKRYSGSYGRGSRCYRVQNTWPRLQQEDCTSKLPCICEMAVLRDPNREYSLP